MGRLYQDSVGIDFSQISEESSGKSDYSITNQSVRTINRFEASYLTGRDVSEFMEPKYLFNEFISMQSGICPKRFMSLFAKKANGDGMHFLVRFDLMEKGSVDSFGRESDWVFSFS